MGTFTLDLKQFSEKAARRADDIVGAVVVKIAQRLDLRSPVGDASYWKSKPPKGYVGGRFRGNWQMKIGAAPVGETGRIDKTGAATLGAIIAEVPEQAAGRVYYIANNVPYAQRIEEGWSRQAPQGLVGLTVVEFQDIVAAAAAGGTQ